MPIKLNFFVGRQRVSANLDPTKSGYLSDIRSQFRGIQENYKKALGALMDTTPDAMYNALEPTFEKSQTYCPFDTGELRGSGYLEITKRGDNPKVEIGYAKGNRPHYGVIVHENLELNHKSPTRAKFLQSALEEDQGKILERVAGELRVLFSD